MDKTNTREDMEGQPEVSLSAPSSPSGKARLPRPPAIGLLPHHPLRDREGALWTPHVLAVTHSFLCSQRGLLSTLQMLFGAFPGIHYNNLKDTVRCPQVWLCVLTC